MQLETRGLNRTELFRLYEVTVGEESKVAELFNQRLNYFVAATATVLGAAVLGIAYSSQWWHYLLPGVLFLATAMLAYSGTRGFQSGYERWLRVMTMRMKLEHLLGFHLRQFDPEGLAIWPDEGLVSAKFSESRATFRSSEKFVAERLTKGMAGVADKTFQVFTAIGVLGALGCFLAAPILLFANQ